MKDAPKSQRNKNTEVFDSQTIILIKSAQLIYAIQQNEMWLREAETRFIWL